MSALLRPEILALLIPSVALMIPVVALMIPIVAVVGGLVRASRRDKLLHETIRLLAEKGHPIPPDLLEKCNPTLDRIFGFAEKGLTVNVQRRSPLQRGIPLVAVGCGLATMLWVMNPESWFWSIGMIPLFLGLGYLLVWKLESQPRS
jgi:hypothetical protein